MTAIRLRLRAAAGVWREIAVCEPDFAAVVASPDEVAGWGAGLPIETDELARAAIGDRVFFLIAAPGIGVAWVAAEALQPGEPSGRTLLVTPTAAYGVQTRCDRRGVAPEPDGPRTVWQLAGETDGPWLPIRRLVRGVPVGPLCCVSADDVLERWSSDSPDETPDDADLLDLAEQPEPEPAASASAIDALLAFLGRGPAEAQTAPAVIPANAATEAPIAEPIAEPMVAPFDARDAEAATSPETIATQRTADAHSPSSDRAALRPAPPSNPAPGSRGASGDPRSNAAPDVRSGDALRSRAGDDAHRAAQTSSAPAAGAPGALPSRSSAGDPMPGALVDSTASAGARHVDALPSGTDRASRSAAHLGSNASAGPYPAAPSSSHASLGAPGAAGASPSGTGDRTPRGADAASSAMIDLPRSGDAMSTTAANGAASGATHAMPRAMPGVQEAAASRAVGHGSPGHARSNAIQGAPRTAETMSSAVPTAAASPDTSHPTQGTSSAASVAHPALAMTLPPEPGAVGESRGRSAPSSTPLATADAPAASSSAAPEAREAPGASDAKRAASSSAQPASGAAPRHTDPLAAPHATAGDPGTPAREPAPRSRIAIARRHGDDLGLPVVPPTSRSSIAPAGREDRSAAPAAQPLPAIRYDAGHRQPLAATPPPIAAAMPTIAPTTAAVPTIAPTAAATPTIAPTTAATPTIAPTAAAAVPTAPLAAATPTIPSSTAAAAFAQIAAATPIVPAAPVAVATAPAATDSAAIAHIAAARTTGDAAPAPRAVSRPVPPPALDDLPVATIVDTGAPLPAMPSRPAARRAANREVRVGDIVVEIGDPLPLPAIVEHAGSLTAAIPHRSAFDHTAASRHSLLPRRRV